MKRLLLALGVLAATAGCSSSSSTSSTSGSTGKTSAATSTTTSATTSGGATSSGSTTSTTGVTSGTTGLSGSGSTGGASTTSASGSTGGSGSGSTGGSTGTTASCDGAGVPNDACSGRVVLALDTPVTGDTTQAKADFNVVAGATGCTALGYTGNDMTYSFTAPATAPFLFTVAPVAPTDGGSGNLDAVIDVVATCAAGNVSACLAGADNGASGVSEAVAVPLNQGQTVTVIVGGYSCNSNGPFTLTVHQNPPPPANDLCANASALTSADGGYFTAQGDTTSATNKAQGACGGSSGPEVFYAFNLAAPSTVSATVTPRNPPTDGGGYTPVVYLRDGCDVTDGGASSLEESCSAASTGGQAASLSVPRLAAGNYVAVVDGYAGTSGPFDLVLTIAPPPPVPANDTCAAPTPITLSAQGDGGFFGAADFTTVGANDTYQPQDGGNCAGSYVSGPDVTFHATLPSATAPFTVSYLYVDGGVDQGTTTLLVRASPCDTGAELTCGNLGPVTGTATSTDLYIIVDDNRAGPYAAGTLTVTSP